MAEADGPRLAQLRRARRIREERFRLVRYGMSNSSPSSEIGIGFGGFLVRVPTRLSKWPDGVFSMVGKSCFEGGCVFGLRCGRYFRIKGVDTLVERFIVNGDIDVFGKALNGSIDFRQRSTALESHRETTGHGEQTLEHPADPNIFLQVLRSAAQFACTGL